ncbi:MAG: cytochrome c oxidase assembly protein [Xanthomonadales bacterium]|nr:cytochrome c oxidase assembly protein [Xanthomonadales bacterium]NIN60499.1 cytochrome c oxidase assembly protein [Xanthomonadales bacterium]NIN75854.1 cytochrome c oxidase assembly protein [Xanthomonadales bacterium]NIO15244.1 cytochrome c oxidase assembly protein [Xanthomonadales bacterium]NIP12892.1 cytochrome c oxidase assembly protein [Xanthomonadales bacterium]
MSTGARHGALVARLLLVAAAMFAFGVFAMPPLYEKFCEITGIGQAGVGAAASKATAPAVPHAPRRVEVRFDATANSALPWRFKPLQRHMEVVLGAAGESAYLVENLSDEAIAGRAVYNVTPPEAAPYFVKTECFCFARQELAGGERREMPVRFYIAAGLPEDIRELTLSYTFFRNDDDPGLAARSADPSG